MTELKTPTERIRGIQLAIYKHGQRFELGKTENKSRKWPERDPTLGLLDCESNALITQPCCPPQLPSKGKLYLSSMLQKLGYFDYTGICWHALARSSFDTNDLSYYFQSITQISSIILLFEDNQYYSMMALKQNTTCRLLQYHFFLFLSTNQ